MTGKLTSAPGQSVPAATKAFNDHVAESLGAGTVVGLALAIHATQDGYSPAHKNYQTWYGFRWRDALSLVGHFLDDNFVSGTTYYKAKDATKRMIQDWVANNEEACDCEQ